MSMVEDHSTARRGWMIPRAEQFFPSDHLRTEPLRATRRTALDLMDQARAVLDSLMLVAIFLMSLTPPEYGKPKRHHPSLWENGWWRPCRARSTLRLPAVGNPQERYPF